jgi:hypothetical protein
MVQKNVCSSTAELRAVSQRIGVCVVGEFCNYSKGKQSKRMMHGGYVISYTLNMEDNNDAVPLKEDSS